MKRVELGRVARAHGIRGEVRVQLHWAGSSTLLGVDQVHLQFQREEGERAYRVLSARPGNRAVLLLLEGIEDRDAAERLRGARVLVPRELLPALEQGEYYLSDLVGAKVVCRGEEIGSVVEIRVHPTVDSLVIRAPDGSLLEQPIAEPWVENVDSKAGVVHLSTRDGLL